MVLDLSTLGLSEEKTDGCFSFQWGTPELSHKPHGSIPAVLMEALCKTYKGGRQRSSIPCMIQVGCLCCASPQFPHSQNRGGLLTNNSFFGLSKVLGSNSRLMFLGRVSCFNTCFSISRSRNSGKRKRKSKSHKSAFIIFSSPFLCEARDHQRKHTGNAALKFIPRVRKHRWEYSLAITHFFSDY